MNKTNKRKQCRYQTQAIKNSNINLMQRTIMKNEISSAHNHILKIQFMQSKIKIKPILT